MSDQDKVDLHSLTQKELLIVTYQKVEGLQASLASITEKQTEQEVRLAIIETKQKITGMLWGSISGAVTAGIVALFLSLFK